MYSMITKVAFVAKLVFCDIFFHLVSARVGGGYSFFSVITSRKIALKKLLTLCPFPKNKKSTAQASCFTFAPSA